MELCGGKAGHIFGANGAYIKARRLSTQRAAQHNFIKNDGKLNANGIYIAAEHLLLNFAA